MIPSDIMESESQTHSQASDSFSARRITADAVRELMAHNVFRWILAYLFLANTPIWACQHFFLTPPRAIFNVDYVLVGIFGLYVPGVLYYAAFTTVFLIDVLANATAIYYFSQQDLLSAAKYIIQLPWQHTTLIATTLLLCGFGLASLCRMLAGSVSQKRRTLMSASFCGVAIILLGLGAFTGSSPFTGSGRTFRDPDLIAGYKIGTSITRRTAISLSEIAKNNLTPTPFRSSRSATSQLFSQLESGALGQQHNIVLVLVESYGLMSDSAGAAKLESPYRTPAVMAKYDVQSGNVPFYGPTVSGELRELCGLKGDISSSQLAHTVADRCLPDLLRKDGYQTTAIHGFLGVMFDRKTWYRALGFENVHFKEDLQNLPGFHECNGLFQGICDTDIASFLGRLSDSDNSEKPHFYYWVTLNSHLPVQVSSENSALLGCSSSDAANADVSICNWMALIYKVNIAIAELSTNHNLPRTEFIVVGDHAPPFGVSSRRKQFSQQVVPFIHLIPKS